MEFLETLGLTTLATLRDVAPIVAVLFGFQFLVLRRRPPNLRRLGAGFFYVLLGLTLFLVGLEEALFPLGETMAEQLTSEQITGVRPGAAPQCRETEPSHGTNEPPQDRRRPNAVNEGRGRGNCNHRREGPDVSDPANQTRGPDTPGSETDVVG